MKPTPFTMPCWALADSRGQIFQSKTYKGLYAIFGKRSWAKDALALQSYPGAKIVKLTATLKLAKGVAPCHAPN